MNDNINSIAFSIHSNKGIYALLLGSGISRNSGIPTGWEIVIDLIRKLAKLENENCEPNPDLWFKNKFKEDPDYSTILEKLANTPSERLNILKPYFEANKEEMEQGLKQPTIAHKQIAKLIQNGHIKVIITTNFDRLLEKALRELGIEPTVINHPDDIDGAIPLVHNELVILKLNGDYLDSRFLNTKKELGDYNQKLKDYALRIIDEFGIITCGWSAKWDNALVNLFKHSSNFRFSSYWTFLNPCNSELEELAKTRRGKTIEIKDADSFFTELYEKIEALETLNKTDTISTEIAVARIKKYVTKEEYRIQFFDLLKNESSELVDELKNSHLSKLNPTPENIKPFVESYFARLEHILPLFINAVYWCKPYHHKYIVEILLRFSTPPKIEGHYYRDSANFQYLPALAILYSIGIISVKNGNYSLLNKCFTSKIANDNEYLEKPFLIEKINPVNMDLKVFNSVIGENYKTAISTFLNKRLKLFFQEYIYEETEFDEIFNVVEYLISLNYMFLVKEGIRSNWAPWGEFMWKTGGSKTTLLDELIKKADLEKENWEPIKQGMFNSKIENYKSTKSNLDEFLKGIHVW